ncbi:MAG: DUF5678 domain-containing protein [Nanoarchaeota archaeon]
MINNIISNFEALDKEDLTKFAGKWIAVVDNKVVVSGESFKEIYTYVKTNYPRQRPLIGKLPEPTPIVLNSIR